MSSKKPGVRTQFFVEADGTRTPIKVRSINPQRESKYAKALERRKAADRPAS